MAPLAADALTLDRADRCRRPVRAQECAVPHEATPGSVRNPGARYHRCPNMGRSMCRPAKMAVLDAKQFRRVKRQQSFRVQEERPRCSPLNWESAHEFSQNSSGFLLACLTMSRFNP